MKAKIIFAWHQPGFIEIPVIRWNTTDVDPFRGPIRTVYQFILLHLRPAGGPIYLRARDGVAGWIVPAHDHRHSFNAALGCFAQQVAVNSPAGCGCNYQLRLVFFKQIRINSGGKAHLGFHQLLARSATGAQGQCHQRGGQPDSQPEPPGVFGPHFPDVAGLGLVVDAPRAAHPPQIGQQPLPPVIHFLEIGVGLFQAQTFKGQPGARKLGRDALQNIIIGQQHNLNTGCQQLRDHIAL